jgi:hypothetical protein
LPPLGPADFPVPAAARESTEAGALTAGRYFIQLTVRAYQQGDPAWISDLSLDCQFCESLVAAVSDDATAGNRVTGGDVTFEDSGQAVLTGAGAEVAFSVSQSPLTVQRPDGSELADRTQPAFRVFTSLALEWSQAKQAWIVTQVINS